LYGTFGDELGEELADSYFNSDWAVPALIHAAADPSSPWFDDATTAARRRPATRSCLRAVSEATADLTEQLGLKDGWVQWGKLHVAVFRPHYGGSQAAEPDL